MNEPEQVTPRTLLAWSLRPHLRTVAVVAALSAVLIGCTVVLPLLIGRAVDELTLGRTDAALLVAAAIAVLGIVGGLALTARGIVAARLSLRVERTLRSRLYGHLHEIDPPLLDGRPSGEWVALTTIDLIPISSFFGLYLASLVSGVLTLVAAAIVMLTINPLLTLLALLPAPLTVFAVVRYRATTRPVLGELRQRLGELTSNVQESIAGAAAIRAAGREDEELRRFVAAGDAVLEQSLAANRRLALFTPAVQTLPSLGAAMVVIAGGLLAIRGHLSVVDFTVFYTYLVMLVPSLQTIGTVIGQAQSALACAERVAGVLNHPREHRPSGPALTGGAAAVALEDVSVRVGPEQREILAGAEVEVAAGGSLAVVGATGSGKSVLVRLINRLSQASEGTVRVGGLPVEELELGSLRGAVAAAGADEFLFAGTIAENIAFGRPGADSAEIETAARCAQAHDFIAALPDGYETRLGDRGAGLSGGQRQRVALARALAAAPGILVLDNATGSLDALTEAAALTALEQHHGSEPPTRIVVGYRPALLRDAAEVLVLVDGRIAERGTHQRLLETSERYRRLVGAE